VIVNHRGGLQWGPRYLLSAMPLLSLAAVLGLEELRGDRPTDLVRFRLGSLLLFLLAATGLYMNSVLGSMMVRDNYRTRVLPLLQLLQGREERFIVVNHPHVPLELVAVWGPKVFFRAEEDDQYLLIADTLWRRGTTRFVLVCQVDRALDQP